MLDRSDCEWFDNCKQRYVNELLCNFGGRTQGGYPDCRECNRFSKKEEDLEKNKNEDLR